MKKAFILLLTFTAFACHYRATEEPVNTAGLIPSEEISIGGILAELKDSISTPTEETTDQISSSSQQINQLMIEVEEIKKSRKPLDQNGFLDRWKDIDDIILLNPEQLTSIVVDDWIALNDSLLKYTEDVRFADALERMVYNMPEQCQLSENQLKSFCYTRLYDRIFINLYGSSALQYEHTTGGSVRLVQDTRYPFDGKINIKVELQDTRYLDMYVRIPEWANMASVRVKGVKYNVVPGQFTEIAKKWKNGDEIEIIIGLRPIVVERKGDPKAFALTYGSLFLSYLKSGNDTFAFEGDDPIRYLQFVSPPGKMPTFTFSGIRDTTLVLQPLFAEKPNGAKRNSWIRRN